MTKVLKATKLLPTFPPKCIYLDEKPMTLPLAGQFELAEQAYHRSLAIKVRENDLAGQASTLNELSSLYDLMGRLEETVTFPEQAVGPYMRFGDLANEGRVRNNLAETLIKLRRYDEARQELQRAIECSRPYGHAAQLWRTWSILEDLEHATGHAEAAQAARQQAIETYLAYRRAVGVSQSPATELFALVSQAIQDNTKTETQQQLNTLLERAVQPHFIALIRQLQSILAGDRNPALAADPELHYMNAAELQILLESLTPG